MRYLHFADICIDTHNHLLYRQGETIKLAPKVYDLLVFFCQNSHRVISKDELMEQVWTGTLVTENAISRTLVKVRKALADDPKNPQFIITVPRKGYRMVADFVASEMTDKQLGSASLNNKLQRPDNTISLADNISANLSTEPQQPDLVSAKQSRDKPLIGAILNSKVSNSKVSKNTLLIIVSFIVITVLISVQSLKNNSALQTKQVKALTRDVGIEFYPALSPDLTQLAYTKEVSSTPSYINIENLSTHVKQSISHARGALSKPVWSPTEQKLAFLYQHNSVCMIYWASLDNIKNKDSWQDITECSSDSSPHFVFSVDGKHLYFNDRQSASHGYQVFRVNLANNEKDIINQPITNGLGNYSFDISPDGEKLVMVNSEFSPTTRLYTLDIGESKLEQTAKLDYLMRAVIWHHDNETIIHPSPHPAYEVWQSNLAGVKLAVVASNTSRVKHLSRLNNGKDFSFVSYLLNRDILFKSNSQNIVELDNSTVMDYLPTMANTSNKYAFVSKRTTSAEVYQSDIKAASTGERSKQLSYFNNPVKLYDLVYSPNDSQLMILADNQIYIADTNTMAVIKLPLDNMAIVGVSWQDETNLLLSSIKNSDWYVMSYNIVAKKISPFPFGYQGGVYSALDDSYYLIADDSFQVMKFSDLSAKPQATSLVCQPSIINRKLNLKVSDQGLLCQSSAESNQYMHYSFATKQSQLWQKSMPSNDFDINENGIIYTKMKQSVSDIMQTTSL